ncbi:MAG TPA: M20/M25/M40 family metallo-hydrolase, partial [Blastocatellia bacterium]|nr:M20/M25/M40 family metallo-hydrolase [Blastocatellia bacterium]
KEEAVVYTAHYDAFGIGADGRIYPGAADNALGVAEMISVAEALSQATARPRRSIIFLAVTGEEYGLLGTEHWVKHPTWKIQKLAANFNFDGMGTEVYGPVKRVVGFGMEHSDLGAMLEQVSAATGSAILPDPMPEEKAFYRSDHYAFVKKGVPALMLLGAPEMERSALVARLKKWEETDYHQPTDTVRAEWNWDGPRAIAVIGLIVGMRVAERDQMPAWLPSSPFNQPRGTNKQPPPEQ